MKILRAVDRTFWWDIARACPYATFFHTPLWADLAAAADPRVEGAAIGAVRDDGTRIVLPMVRTGSAIRGLWRNYASTFAGCYGGAIATGPVSPAELDVLHRSVVDWRAGRVGVTGNPLADADRGDAGVWPNAEVEGDFTQILTLDMEADDVLSRFSSGNRRNVRKARRKGVEVRAADSLEDYRAYFGAYEDSLRRWGDSATSVYPWRLFEQGCRIAREHPEQIKLWLAEVDGTVIAGAWVFYWNEHVDYWHGAAYEEYFDHRPNNVLHAHIISDAVAQGYRYYDFNPSGGHDGVVRFKKTFGAEKWPFERVAAYGRVYRIAARARRLVLA